MLKSKYNYGDVMKYNLKEYLYDLKKKEEGLKKSLDIDYYDRDKRTYCFNKLKETRKEIKKVEFKIKMENMKNEKFRKDI